MSIKLKNDLLSGQARKSYDSTGIHCVICSSAAACKATDTVHPIFTARQHSLLCRELY